MPDESARYGKEYRKEKNQQYYDRHYRGAIRRHPKTESAICFKCKKPYKAGKNQHPKYSLCPLCKKENEQIISGSRWVGHGIPGRTPPHSTLFSDSYGEVAMEDVDG